MMPKLAPSAAAVALAAILTAAPTARAEAGPEAAAEARPEPPASALELARLQITPETWDRTLSAMARQMGDLVRRMGEQQGKSLPPEFMQAIMDDATHLVTYDEAVAINADVFGRIFTEDELRDLIAFYRTPTGQRLVQLQPQIVEGAMQQTNALVQARMPAFMARCRERVERYIKTGQLPPHQKT